MHHFAFQKFHNISKSILCLSLFQEKTYCFLTALVTQMSWCSWWLPSNGFMKERIDLCIIPYLIFITNITFAYCFFFGGGALADKITISPKITFYILNMAEWILYIHNILYWNSWKGGHLKKKLSVMYNISNIFITKYGVQFLMYIMLNLNYMKNEGGGHLQKILSVLYITFQTWKGGHN